MKAEAIIIQRPDHQSPAQRVFFGLATLVAWAFWVFLWLPLITLVAWGFGFRTTYVEMFVQSRGKGGTDLVELLLLAAVCALIVIAWSLYNRFRYGGRVRRRAFRSIQPDETAHAMGTTESAVLAMRDARISTIEFADDGALHVGEIRDR
ncbi:poly-beta-1,6-N-acetyl-D-glucosamine biosynthesis protein PgaD [Luteibacter rhizovicinus]|uniref:Poly-beta-1,6-N-acetyl-D-glucosamine biosynthesis protein PgaD n=1 Tax=Luteibacter rhizovicinus TaxID=242606 RepID=A0A4R3YM49_9GAMM|nr:poly-beta-1,6-N-acetyl-D-glucosamine biosynthesis protein PgaD [Luteibacter rhizovicinus]TCV93331.1 poly-beta-1,6-N-acetyl-D-glucosamine biosynthesis protein PgaD [Luteibacter rhizovicinus]